MDPKIKYSVIFPYYDRFLQLSRTLNSFKKYYHSRDDYEIIIIEDAKNAMNDNFHRQLLMVINDSAMPIKRYVFPDVIYNPAPLYNLGVKKSNGEYLIITNPECLHRVNILDGLDDEFVRDKNCYVVCGCLSYKRDNTPDVWYQHSEHHNMRYHFCSALSKKTYINTGGFIEEFGQGYAYDDDAFRETLVRANVKFVLRDDLLTVHQWHIKTMPVNRRALLMKNEMLYKSLFEN